VGFVDYLLIAVVLAAGGALQSAAGFGYALLSVTLLMLLGLEPFVAIPIVTMATTVQSLTGVWQQRRDVPWRLVLAATSLVLITIPVGVFLLGRLTVLDGAQIRQVFGAVLIVVVVIYALWRPQPRQHVHTFWTVTAMLCGGLLGGLCGMAGPPIVLWAISHQWSSQRTRATLWAIFLLKTPLVIVFLYQRFGWVVIESALLALAMVPAVLLGTFPGIWVGNRLPKSVLRRVAIVLLIWLGLYMLCQPMIADKLIHRVG
jgi:uncharacterized membrane protein YfcA